MVKPLFGLEFSKIPRKNQALSQSIRKGTSNAWLIIIQYHLVICSKVIEKFAFNPVVNFLEQKLSHHQSDFCLKDPCRYQLLAILHSIYANFDESFSLEVRTNFLDISKTFNKVWYEGLL